MGEEVFPDPPPPLRRFRRGLRPNLGDIRRHSHPRADEPGIHRPSGAVGEDPSREETVAGVAAVEPIRHCPVMVDEVLRDLNAEHVDVEMGVAGDEGALAAPLTPYTADVLIGRATQYVAWCVSKGWNLDAETIWSRYGIDLYLADKSLPLGPDTRRNYRAWLMRVAQVLQPEENGEPRETIRATPGSIAPYSAAEMMEFRRPPDGRHALVHDQAIHEPPIEPHHFSHLALLVSRSSTGLDLPKENTTAFVVVPRPGASR
ncbi:hypothetical protein [Microbacterium testaceum]|uniref:hypothetical protein n=1 Tax=Microbacterium testaceum TaxID=2033 RepID=UPI00115F9F5A|nr:hypothetical protein [Microbacterium testaceum]